MFTYHAMHANNKNMCTRMTNYTMEEIQRLKRNRYAILVQNESMFVYDSGTCKVLGPRENRMSQYHKKIDENVMYDAISDPGKKLFRMYTSSTR